MSIIEYIGPSNPQDIRQYLKRRTKDVIIGKYLELWREYGKLEEREQALAAHVERGRAIMSKLCENDFNNRRADQELFGWYTDAPTTSLARHKARWKAEGALDVRRLTQGDDWEDQDLREVIDDYIASCCQAGGGE